MAGFTRRQFSYATAASALLIGMSRFGFVDEGQAAGSFPVSMPDAQWKQRLTRAQYEILRRNGTERAFTSPLDHEHRAGLFDCAGCDQALYSSKTKFDSHTGWPSFWAPIEGAVGTGDDTSFGMDRTSVHCSRCGGHIGHVFKDGPPPTGLRYCMNGVALRFRPGAA